MVVAASLLERYDYIIVGAGAAGCVLAGRLSLNPHRSILLLEAGPPATGGRLKKPASRFEPLAQPAHPLAKRYATTKGPHGGREDWVTGRTLGGSSAINAMVYTSGTPADYDAWEAAGCTGWGWHEMARCLAAMENHELGESETRGSLGPVCITMPPERSALGTAIIAAAAQAGIPSVSDINHPDDWLQGGCGWQPCTIWEGQRFDSTDAFLAPAVSRKNLHVVTGAQVLAVEFTGHKASGVRLRHAAQTHSIAAHREVILSAGAIETPKLLQLSGIGPAAVLQAHGITVRADRPAVGQNLRDHRMIVIQERLAGEQPYRAARLIERMTAALQYRLRRAGPYAQAGFVVGGYVKSSPGLARPDSYIGLSPRHPGQPGLSLSGFIGNPQSQGSVQIRSADPAAPPDIIAGYMTNPADRAQTIALYRLMIRILTQPALARFTSSDLAARLQSQTDDDISAAINAHSLPAYDISGTCRMGRDDQAVLTPDLKLRGFEGLRVVDASVMPAMVTGHHYGPVTAIAWRAAELINADAHASIQTKMT